MLAYSSKLALFEALKNRCLSLKVNLVNFSYWVIIFPKFSEGTFKNYLYFGSVTLSGLG